MLRNPNVPAASYGYMWGNDRSYTAADLDKDCSEKKGIREAKCVAYIRGIADGLFVASVVASMNGHTCMPEIMPSEVEVRQIVEKYLRDHPEQKAANASAVAGIALSTALKTSCTPRIESEHPERD